MYCLKKRNCEIKVITSRWKIYTHEPYQTILKFADDTQYPVILFITNVTLAYLENGLHDQIDDVGVLVEVPAKEGRIGELVQCTRLQSVTLLTLLANQKQIMTDGFKTGFHYSFHPRHGTSFP